MRLGALVLQQQPWLDAVSTWREIERLGFDTGYVADHLTHSTVAGRWWADGWTTLAAAAGVTDRLVLGTLVASAAVRSPAVIARCAATLQDISAGRFVLGLGSGLAADALADRGEELTSNRLWQRYVETVSAVRALWTGSSTWSGSSIAVQGVLPSAHAPGQLAPKIVLAAGGPRGFDLVARQGDGWVTYGGPALADLDRDGWWAAVEGQSAQVTRACERIMRDPVSIRRVVLLGYGAYRPLESGDALAYAVERAEAAGFDEVVVYAPMGQRGDPYWSDPEVFESAVSSVRRQPS